MFSARLNAWLKRRFQSTIEVRSALPQRRTIPLALERLEARDCPSLFAVTTTADSGPGSLRAAILAADKDTDTNGAQIVFDIGAKDSQQTIALLSDLPQLTNPNGISIDATTQASSNTSLTMPLITLTPAAGASVSNGLVASANKNLIQGLNIQGFAADGVLLLSNFNQVTFDEITANHQAGVVLNNAAHNSIGFASKSGNYPSGNVISGNLGNGVALTGSGTANNSIEGNFIGTDRTGVFALANQGTGVVLANGANTNLVGLSNVISGNRDNGVGIIGAGTVNNMVAANNIGTDGQGTSALGNGNDGVRIAQGAAGNGVEGFFTSEFPQVIAGNAHFGVEIDSAGTSVNLVLANLIGLGFSSNAIPNGLGGVLLDGAANNTIGGPLLGIFSGPNVISGNNGPGRAGILMIDSAAGNVVQSNLIGTDRNGTNSVPNQANGILLSLGSNHNTIGGCTSATGNVISGNNANGIGIDNAPSNVIVGNRIGTNQQGNAALPNQGSGIVVLNGANLNTIGGSVSGCANVISGNRDSGIGIGGGLGNVVAGNLIGTGTNPNTPIANGFAGVVILGPSSQNLIGGPNNQGNLIAANRIGVLLSGSNNNQVQSNSIVNNTKAGVLMSNNASNNQIGGAGQGNDIFGNGSGLHGVGGVFVDSGTGNLISQNSIHDNVQNSSTTTNPGIGLNGTNHANNDIPAPILLTAHTTSTTAGTTVTFSGSYNVTGTTAMDRVFTIEFFSNTAGPDGNGFCQGETFLGSETVTIDAGQTFTTFTSPAFFVPTGQNFFTATATDAAHDTSTFSNCVMGAAAK